MKIIISPAKSLNFETEIPFQQLHQLKLKKSTLRKVKLTGLVKKSQESTAEQ